MTMEVPTAAQITHKGDSNAEGQRKKEEEVSRLMGLQRDFTALHGSEAMAHSTLQVCGEGV